MNKLIMTTAAGTFGNYVQAIVHSKGSTPELQNKFETLLDFAYPVNSVSVASAYFTTPGEWQKRYGPELVRLYNMNPKQIADVRQRALTRVINYAQDYPTLMLSASYDIRQGHATAADFTSQILADTISGAIHDVTGIPNKQPKTYYVPSAKANMEIIVPAMATAGGQFMNQAK